MTYGEKEALHTDLSVLMRDVVRSCAITGRIAQLDEDLVDRMIEESLPKHLDSLQAIFDKYGIKARQICIPKIT